MSGHDQPAAQGGRWPTFTVPVMVCANGHRYETVFPATFRGMPCRECGSPLRRPKACPTCNTVGAKLCSRADCPWREE